MNKTVENFLYNPGSKADRGIYMGLLTVIAIIFSLLELWMPLQLDDLTFAAMYLDYNGGSDKFSLNALAAYFMDMRQYDNARISNLMSPFSTLIRPWCDLFPYITGLVTVFVVDMMRRLGSMNLTYTSAGILIWVMMILFLPWRNSILVYDYMLNYMYSAAVTLLFLWLLCVKLEESRSNLLLIAVTLVAILAGGWHEGFALPVLVALFVEYLICRCRKPWRWYLPVAVYVVASALFALSPGILTRFTREIVEESPAPIYKTVADLSLVLLLSVSIAVFLCVPRLRKVLKEVTKGKGHLFVIFTVAAVVGALISLRVLHTPRTSFWPQMCAIVSLMLLYAPLIKGRKTLRGVAAVSLLLFAGCVGFSVNVLEWQYRYKQESDILLDRFEKSADGTVFYDIIMPEELPLSTLYMNPKSSWVTGFHYYCLDRFFGMCGHIVVPESLRYPKRDAKPVSVAGDIYATGGALWTRYIPDINVSGEGFFRVRMKNDSVQDVEGLIHPFVSADGDTLTYIKVYKLPVAEMDDVEITGYSKLPPEKIEYRKIGKPSLLNEDEVIYGK